MLKVRITSIIIIAIAIAIGFFVYNSEQNPESSRHFKYGLDLSGGTHLVYRADVSGVSPSGVFDSMDALRDVIERRVNLFGVAEPIVQIERTSGVFSESQENRLIVELPGITDVDQAVAMIGQTPLLEFRLENTDPAAQKALSDAAAIIQGGGSIDGASLPDPYLPTDLTGRYLDRAVLTFNNLTGEPTVLLEFDSEGADLFAQLTAQNRGRILAIFLDGAPISTPVIQEEITGGRAEISGQFTPDEAKELVGRLNSGALPVPIHLLSTQTIGASLGVDAKERGVEAGVIGLAIVALFMFLWYRLPGVISIVALSCYVLVMLALFKVIPVTLTAAGIAGFILSIGMAVDANVLIFERIKEELRKGTELREAITKGFKRAWLAIRDSNISSIITAVILFWFGTSLIKGFALVFGIGVIISMLTAISITRTLLLATTKENPGSFAKFLFGSGLFNLKTTE